MAYIDLKMRVQKLIRLWGVPKEQTLDYMLEKMVAEKTDFDIKKIILLVAKKTRMKEYNEFNYFEFRYRGKNYTLFDDVLTEN